MRIACLVPIWALNCPARFARSFISSSLPGENNMLFQPGSSALAGINCGWQTADYDSIEMAREASRGPAF
jgi:hypothetical protein